MNYNEFVDRLMQTGIISDAWVNGVERFQLQPVLLTNSLAQRFYTAAEAVGEVYQELSEIIWRESTYLDDEFSLTPFQKLMWFSSGGNWHVIARLDVFLTQDNRVQICEMNSDTPSGEAEAVILNQILSLPNTIDPNGHFEDLFCNAVISYYHQHTKKSNPKPVLALIFPTDLPEDLSMIELYRRWFEKRGCSVVLGSPRNLFIDINGKVCMFDSVIDIAFRHYKTDWWGERESSWVDGDPFEDSEPLATELKFLIEAEQKKELVVINPFGAILTQNKLTMAFLWNHISLFNTENQNAIRSYIPKSLYLSDFLNRKNQNKDQWVLKSDYGCEGDEVIIGKYVTEEIWNASLEKAKPHRWMVQQYFEAQQNNSVINFGVYLIAGKASGVFTRISSQATDGAAKCAATFINATQEV